MINSYVYSTFVSPSFQIGSFHVFCTIVRNHFASVFSIFFKKKYPFHFIDFKAFFFVSGPLVLVNFSIGLILEVSRVILLFDFRESNLFIFVSSLEVILILNCIDLFLLFIPKYPIQLCVSLHRKKDLDILNRVSSIYPSVLHIF